MVSLGFANADIGILSIISQHPSQHVPDYWGGLINSSLASDIDLILPGQLLAAVRTAVQWALSQRVALHPRDHSPDAGHSSP